MKKMTVYECIKHLEETPGKKDKLAFLQSQVDNHYLKVFFQAALDPFTQYHVRKIPEYDPKTNVHETITLKRGLAILPLLSEKHITGNVAIAKLKRTLEDLEYDDALVLERIIEKHPNCGVSISTVNKVWPGLVREYPVALCTPYSDEALSKISYPALAQLKADGARANALKDETNVITYCGRSGKEMHILSALDDEVRLLCMNGLFTVDGEFVVVDDEGNILPRKTSNGIINKAIQGKISQEEADRIRFIVWDLIPMDEVRTTNPDERTTTMIERFRNLEERHASHIFEKIAISESRVVNSIEEARAFFAEMLDRGEEGAIIKNFDTKWAGRRLAGFVKMKVEHEVELKVVACNEGTKANKGKLGAFTAVSSDGGLSVDVGSGLLKEEREEYWKDRDGLIGKIITVKSNDYSSASGSDILALTHPVFIEFRSDKDEADTTQSIVDGFDAIYGRNTK